MTFKIEKDNIIIIENVTRKDILFYKENNKHACIVITWPKNSDNISYNFLSNLLDDDQQINLLINEENKVKHLRIINKNGVLLSFKRKR